MKKEEMEIDEFGLKVPPLGSLAFPFYQMTYLPEISKFAVQKHEYNGSNSPVYFNTREEVLNFIKSLPLKV